MKPLFLIVPMSDKIKKMIESDTQTNVTINVNFSSFLFSEKGTITGEISLSKDNIFFPEKHWNDFIVEIFGWWLSDLRSMIENGEKEQDFAFKDGDFCFLLSEKNNTNWTISMFEEIPPQTPVNEFVLQKKEFLRNLLAAVRETLKFCGDKGWDTPDVKNLQIAFEKFEKHPMIEFSV